MTLKNSKARVKIRREKALKRRETDVDKLSAMEPDFLPNPNFTKKTAGTKLEIAKRDVINLKRKLNLYA